MAKPLPDVRAVPPLSLRQLKADMVLKGLSLNDVSSAAGVPYPVASAILNGRLDQPERLILIRKIIADAPMPEEQLQPA